MKYILHSLAFVGFLFGASFMLCGVVGFAMHDAHTPTSDFFYLGVFCFFLSIASWFLTLRREEIGRRDAVLLVLFGWIFSGILGALPYITLHITPDIMSGLFESFSGLTTTGASVLSDLESLPASILFWRCLSHFLGGVGILIMFIAILPFVGAGAVQLYKAESTGLFTEKLTPKVADTARIVLGVYLLLNLLCTLALKAGGLSWFDAVCHAFSSIATGGFSTRSDSVAAFHSAYVEWVITCFMFLSGISFILHYRFLKGDLRSYFGNSELRLYLSLCVGVGLFATLLLLRSEENGLAWTLRQAFFQTVSLISTSGFTTVDYDVWPSSILLLFLLIMILGASAGSTSGAIKLVRVVVMYKQVVKQFKTLLHPGSIQPLRLDGNVIQTERAQKAFSYVVMYLITLAMATFLISLFTPDILTAVSAVVACLGGVGPGLASAGPLESYAHFPALAKFILIATMLLGRLEIYMCIAVFFPSFWKA